MSKEDDEDFYRLYRMAMHLQFNVTWQRQAIDYLSNALFSKGIIDAETINYLRENILVNCDNNEREVERLLEEWLDQ